MGHKLTLTAFLCVFFLLPSHAQDGYFHFTKYSVDDGLSQSTVNSICQDGDGALWVATHSGLNRYDGYGFDVFLHDPDDPRSIADNMVRCVFSDSLGRLWVGTDKGLSHYDASDECFSNFVLPGGEAVICLEQVGVDSLMVGTEGGLYIFDVSRGKFMTASPGEGLPVLKAYSLLRMGDSIFVGTYDSGVFSYSIGEGEFRKMSQLRGGKPVQCLCIYGSGCLWAGTEGDGLYMLNLNNGETIRYSSADGSISSDFVRSLAKDTEGRLWIGTFGGLDILDETGFSHHRHEASLSGSLSQNSIRCIFLDNQGGMWLGTWFRGLNYYHPLRNRFLSVRDNGRDDSLNDDIVNCIVQDDRGTLWVGTNSGGLNRRDKEDEGFRHYMTGNVGSNDIKAVYVPSESRKLYVGAHAGGLSILDRDSDRITRIPGGPQDVYAVIPADDKDIWVGSLEGLYLFDAATEEFLPAISLSEDSTGETEPVVSEYIVGRVKALLIDSEEQLWVGGEDGVAAYHRDGANRLFPLPVNGDVGFVQCLHESSMGQIWIGTRQGLCCYDKETGGFSRLTNADGLPSNTVNGIEEDEFGRLWVSTDRGLSCVNYYSGSIRNFSKDDGLPGNQYNPGAHTALSDGRLCFGGVNGMVIFHPGEIDDNPYSPKAFISGLEVRNTPIRPGDESGILNESISRTEKITLRPKYRSFSVGFSVINFVAGQKNSFVYMLEGYDKDWQDASSRSAHYSNLSPGSYRFVVKAANNDGKWNEEPATLSIRILPRWYDTVWFKLGVLLLVLLAVWLFIRFLLERMDMQRKVELEKREREHQEEINEMKISFFVNISHEFRSPLTLIMNLIQEMADKTGNPWMRRQLKLLQSHANRLLRMVNQLIDYRRADLGVLRLSVHKESASRLVEENFRYYSPLAKSRHLHYSLSLESGNGPHLIDPDYLQIIENNLLSNAFKYTSEGSVSVRLAIEGDELMLQVTDTGLGIAKEQQEKIFQRFYQADKSHGGSGIGLSLVQRLVQLHHGHMDLDSKPGEGSTFRVYFPQSLEKYTEDEIWHGPPEDESPADRPATESILSDEEAGLEAASGDGVGGTVLVVEDDTTLRDYLKSRLGKDFTVFTATNGKEALEVVHKGGVNAVITDVSMPVMDGIKLCAAIKRDPGLCSIPVIMLSSKSEAADQLSALDVGADDYLAKPFSITVLSAKIRNALKMRKRMAEIYLRSEDWGADTVTFNKRDEELLLRMIGIVEANLDNPEFSILDMAEAMNMSRSNLYVKMKALTGASAKNFILKIRLREACRLIKDGRYSLSQIKDMVGFGSASYFSVCFKRHIGCLPREYARK